MKTSFASPDFEPHSVKKTLLFHAVLTYITHFCVITTDRIARRSTSHKNIK